MTEKVSGRVTDAETKQPLSGVNIVVNGTTIGAATDQLGWYRLENLIADTYQITASHIGYRTETAGNISVSRDRSVRLDFQLIPVLLSLETVEVTGDRPQATDSRSVRHITREDIESSQAASLGALLDRIPGVEIHRTGGAGAEEKISIRGSQTNEVLVLLDGIKINDALTGEADLASVPLFLIEQIKVYHGGASDRFGSGAIGGVVEISTRDHLESRSQVRTAVGPWGFRQGGLMWSGSYGSMNGQLLYQYQESQNDYPYQYQMPDEQTREEERINADLLSRHLIGRWQIWRNHHRLAVHWGRMRTQRGLPGKINNWTAYARVDRERDRLGMTYRYDQPRAQLSLSLQHSRTEREDANLWPDDAELRYRRCPRYHYISRLTTTNLDTRFQYRSCRWLGGDLGFQSQWLRYRDEDLYLQQQEPIGSARDRSMGLYLSQEWTWRNEGHCARASLHSSLRYDHMALYSDTAERTQGQWSPALGMVLSLGDDWQCSLRGHLARSFRLPTFADLFYEDVRIQGKSNLLAEKGLHQEVGVGGVLKWWGRLEATATIFDDRIDDLIVWRLGDFETFSPFNTDAHIEGREYSLEWSTPGRILTAGMSYSLLWAVNKSGSRTTHNKLLPFRPRRSGRADVNVRVEPLLAGLHYRSVGERFVTESNTVKMSPHWVLDSEASLQVRLFAIDIELRMACYNLTDENYQVLEDMPLPPREWRVGLSLERSF